MPPKKRASADRSRPLQERDPNAQTEAPSSKQNSKKTFIRFDRPITHLSRAQRQGIGQEADSSRKRKSLRAADLADVHLPGEEDETVPIFDTCDDVRRMINKHLKDTQSSQAAFARELSEMLPMSKVEARQLRRFMEFKGPRGGSHCIAFYAGYVFFEKLRIKTGKKKSVKREEMEDAWTAGGAYGVPREGTYNMSLILTRGMSWRFDRLGCIEVN
jgi:hypothetical protein